MKINLENNYIYKYVPLNKLNLVHRFSILAFIPIIMIVALIGSLASYFMMDIMVKEEVDHAVAHNRLIADEFLTIKDFDQTYSVGERNLKDAFTPFLSSYPDYKRIKVYNKSGTILWADKQELIGKNYYVSNNELKKALAGKIVHSFGILSKEENVFETKYKKGLEIYVPILIDGHVVGVVETYRIPTRFLGYVSKTLIVIWSIAFFGGVFVYFSLYWLVKSSYYNQLSLEKKVFESKDRLENLIDGINDGIALIDSDYKILTINRSLAKRFNIPIKDVIGKNMKEYLFKGLKEKGANVDICANNTCSVGKVSSADHELYDEKDKKNYYLNITCFPLISFDKENYVKDSQTSQAVVVVRDVTKEKDLTKELIISEKMATIGTLFPKISHEIKSPLNALGLGLMTLQEKYPNESVLELLMSAKDNLLRISNDLLAFSRAKKEQFTLIDINDVLKKAIVFLRDTTGQIKYHKIVEEYKEIPTVRGIMGQLEQLFINLILNASQAMESLPISKQVLTVGAFEEDDNVYVYVKDSGIGIKKEDYNKIFTPFFTTKPEGKGTGLGMIIIKEIVDNHKASVSFKSEEGVGTTFFVKIPSANLEELQVK